jgi:DNA repair exonuclease SbcCD ATPase subunit
MQKLAGKLKQQNEEGEERETSINAQQLRELLKNLVNSSFDQEKVMQTLKTTSPSDPNYTILAQKQKDIKDNLKTAEDSLYSLSKRVPQIQSTVNKEIAGINDHINKALENLGDRRTAEANRNQQYAMTSMNNLALMLNEALDQLQKMKKNGKGGKGKKQQSMQQLSQMQQQLNQNMQQARDQMQKQGNQGQSQNGSISEQLAKMARQQQMIRQALQEINRRDNKDGSGQSGNMDKIAKQMEQTETDLVNRKITDEALKRQQQIQTRLLEAEKAEQQREQDQKRESNAGKDTPPGYIKALQDFQQIKAKQTEQVKTVSPALNLYYKEKIKSYFDQLNAK